MPGEIPKAACLSTARACTVLDLEVVHFEGDGADGDHRVLCISSMTIRVHLYETTANNDQTLEQNNKASGMCCTPQEG